MRKKHIRNCLRSVSDTFWGRKESRNARGAVEILFWTWRWCMRGAWLGTGGACIFTQPNLFAICDHHQGEE
eukprot:6173401-Pleurochrysis_carterae.AAC.1